MLFVGPGLTTQISNPPSPRPLLVLEEFRDRAIRGGTVVVRERLSVGVIEDPRKTNGPLIVSRTAILVMDAGRGRLFRSMEIEGAGP